MFEIKLVRWLLGVQFSLSKIQLTEATQIIVNISVVIGTLCGISNILSYKTKENIKILIYVNFLQAIFKQNSVKNSSIQ